MFRRTGTQNRIILPLSYYMVFATVFLHFVPTGWCFFENGFFHSRDDGNTLWDELYQKCGNRVSFYCVQNKLMNYINETLDSDLHITDGIYFVKNHNNINGVTNFNNKIIDSDSDTQESSFHFTNDTNSSLYNNRRIARTIKKLTDINNNSLENSTDSYTRDMTATDDEKDEEEFVNFIHTIEKVEHELKTTEKYDNTSSEWHDESNVVNENIDTDADDDKDIHPNGNLVIRSLNKVSDILYDKTTDYLSSHDLRLDLPQIFFGGSKIVVSPRGYDSDGGVILKLNFHPTETSRSGGIAKYFHKMFKKKLLTSFLALLLIIKLIKIKLMYVLPVIIGVNAAKKLLLKTLLFLFPPLVHLFKLCTYYHAHASKLHFHHHKVKHHHHHIKVPVPVPVPVPSHKPHHHHEEYPDHSYGSLPLGDNPEPNYENPSYGTPEYFTRNDMTSQHGDELASWGLKDFYASSESPGVFSAQAQAYSPYAEQNYKILQAQPSKQYAVYKDPLTAAATIKKNKISNNVWKTKAVGHVSSKNTYLMPFDPFYSPILQKIDSIFTQLGFNDEGCRERLICSMYKNPVRFSPHSNLLSAELSRDPTELERPSQSNEVAARFYRYVEAAREGQSQKDCISLYPDCVVKTE